MKNKIFVVLVALWATNTFMACKKKTNDGCKETLVTKEFLQGKWKHDYPNYDRDLSYPDNYKYMKFYEDSFFWEVNHRSDMRFNNGCDKVNWTEYAKGVFEIKNSKLYFTGIYTDSNYIEKTGGCYNIGAYADSFSLKYCNNILNLYNLKLIYYTDEFRTANMTKN